MQSGELQMLAKIGNDAVKRLRKEKFAKGLPFMINSRDLPGAQCYLEYLGGRIFLVTMKSPDDRDFTIIRKLSDQEGDLLRRKFQFI